MALPADPIYATKDKPTEKPKKQPGKQPEEVIIVVDKKTNQLHLTRHSKDGLSLTSFKTFPTTLGQVQGDKLVEGDLKTPNGIYLIKFRSLPSTGLKPKFGSMALYLGYPNVLDRRGHKTGFDILIHGTNDPARLQKKYDSKGCVVLSNEQIESIWPYVQTKKTLVIVTENIEHVINSPRQKRLKDFIQRWSTAWSSKDLERYIDSYAYEFIYDGLNRIQYYRKKKNLNKLYQTIEVGMENVKFYFHEKYDLVTFNQYYRSTRPDGKTAFEVRGRKTLYLQLRNDKYRIVSESLSQK